jgi:hypothetical protein
MSMRLRDGLGLVVLMATLSGCGSGSNTAASTASGVGASGSSGSVGSSGSSGSSGAPIVGVATPSNVSVVTATNAN